VPRRWCGACRISTTWSSSATCVVAKQRRLPFPHQVSFRAKEKLELVHGDLCCPVTPATGGRRYFVLVDDVSHYMWAILLDIKAAASDAIKRHQAAAEECGRKLSCATHRERRQVHGG
jgi:hypothetical protein